MNRLNQSNSLRAASRIVDVSINTVTKLLVDTGKACQRFQNDNVVNVVSKRIQCDEIWSFVYSKQQIVPAGMEDEAGDVWTWTALDADSKLIVSWLVGSRDIEAAAVFMQDVASRLTNRVQLTTDGYKSYLDAVAEVYGSQIDFAQLIKQYGSDHMGNVTDRKYSPAKCLGTETNVISGTPETKHISTSYVERQNLTMRMHMRRFTRLTNAFSKKIENHCYAIALHFVYYNFVKQYKTLRVTPAMAAGITKRFMSITDIVNLAPEPVAQKRGSYKKNKAE